MPFTFKGLVLKVGRRLNRQNLIKLGLLDSKKGDALSKVDGETAITDYLGWSSEELQNGSGVVVYTGRASALVIWRDEKGAYFKQNVVGPYK